MWQHKMLLLTVIVICFVPILYAGVFLKSVWDPYSNLSKLPVAVVNEDQPVTYNGQTLNIGQQVEDTLKKDSTFKWEFVTADEAKKGMDEDKYYMTVTLPSDFSAKAATVTNVDPEQMNLKYTTNGSLNYPLETINKSAIQQLESKVSSQVTLAYANSIIGTIKETGHSIQTAADGAGQLNDGLKQADNGVDQMKASTPTLASGVNQLTSGSGDLASGVNQLVSQTKASGEQVKNSLPDLEKLNDGAHQVASATETLSATADKISTDLTNNNDLQELLTIAKVLHSNAYAYRNIINDNSISDDTVIYFNIDASGHKLPQSIPLTKKSIVALNNYLNGHRFNDNATVSFTYSVGDSSKPKTLINVNGKDLNSIKDIAQKYDNPATEQKLNQASTTLKQLPNQLRQLSSGAQQIANGTEQVYNQMSAMSNQLNSAETINNLNRLSIGANQLNGGLKTLNSNIPTLVNGVNQLSNGTKQLVAGSGTLQNKLQQGADTIKNTPLSDKTANMIADPMSTDQSKYSTVKNYGHGFAPYFLSVSLFVGCMMFNFAYPIRKIADKHRGWFGWYLSKVAIGAGVATAMAIIIGSIMMMLGLEVEHFGQFFGILILNANAMMFLIMFLAIAFDNPGRFVAMVILILSLGSAGGTFPVETAPKFYQLVHPFIPMSYTITGLRQAISSGISHTNFVQCFAVLGGVLAINLAFLALAMFIMRRRHGNKAGQSRLDDNQKLLSGDYSNYNMTHPESA